MTKSPFLPDGHPEFRPASEGDKGAFAEWTRQSRIETMTCRPVVAGKRVPPAGETEILACFLPGMSDPVGKVTFFDFNPRNRSAEMGYLVAPAWRGKGVARVMVRAAVDARFRGSDLHKIHAQTAAFNLPSVRLLEGLGFHRDAVLRDHHELDGRFYDDLIYSLLRSEWEAWPTSSP
jgi:RimJ/RimL family protein N-acetyltransferase